MGNTARKSTALKLEATEAIETTNCLSLLNSVSE